MRVIYDENVSRADTYMFKVNQGGELNLRLSNGSNRFVTIKFVNGIFVSATDDVDEEFKGRQYLYLQAAIAEKVEELEARYTSSVSDTGDKS